MNYKRNRRYFVRTHFLIIIPLLLIALAAFGVCFYFNFAIGYYAGGGVSLVALVLLALFIGLTPTTAEIDRVFKKAYDEAVENAKKSAGYSEDESKYTVKPIIMQGFYSENIKSPLQKRARKGVLRTSNGRSYLVLVTSEQLFIYSYLFSIIDDETKKDTEELFLSDIVSFHTSVEKYREGGLKGPEVRKDVLVLTTKASTSITLNFSNNNDLDKITENFRKLMKEKH